MVQNEKSRFEVSDDTPEFLYESSTADESAELLEDTEAAESTLLKFRRHGREAFLSSKEHADGDEPSV